jgi:O-methyltransferase involved in polyketide biosynthesis
LSERDARIAPTAFYTAYVWHRLGLPHASLFATPLGARLFWSLRIAVEWITLLHSRLPSMPQYLEARHRSIDHVLTKRSPDRVIELGAGLSRRGVTWAADHGVSYVEVDLPHMVEAKRRWIATRADAALRERLAGRLDHVAQDVLAPGFAEWLAETLEGAARPVIIAEGVLGYFGGAERAALARSIATGLCSAGGGSFLCDLRSARGGLVERAAVRGLRAGIWLATRGRGAREDFADDAAIRGFFAEAGFSASAPVRLADAVPSLTHLQVPAQVWEALVG